MEKRQYIVLGNGVTGHSAVKEIRKTDKEGSILLISDEAYPTYFRIKLTELIAQPLDEKVYMAKEDWYEKNNVEVLLNTKIKEIDLEQKLVTLDNGQTYYGDKILLATGAASFIPPIKGVEKENIFAIRSLDDLKAFKEALSKANHVTVIGGGLLGLEAAYSVHQAGKPVQVIESFDYLLGRQLNREEGENLAKQLEDLGIEVFCGHNSQEFLGDDKVESILLDDGKTLDTDLVLLSTGVRPRLDLYKSTCLNCNRGIVVDDALKTSEDCVYAAGDAAEFHGVCLGLWTAGMETGKIAGHNMANPGDEKTYESPKNFTELSLGDIQIFSVGQTSGDVQSHKEEREDGRLWVFTKDQKALGGILIGNTKDKNKLKKLVFGNESVDKIKETFPGLA